VSLYPFPLTCEYSRFLALTTGVSRKEASQKVAVFAGYLPPFNVFRTSDPLELPCVTQEENLKPPAASPVPIYAPWDE